MGLNHFKMISLCSTISYVLYLWGYSLSYSLVWAYFWNNYCDYHNSSLKSMQYFLFLHFFCFVLFLKTKDKPCLYRNTVKLVKMLATMIATGSTSHQIGEIVMQDSDLRDSVKALLLKDVDEQCKKLCKKSEECSSVLRVPQSKHKVLTMYVLNDKNHGRSSLDWTLWVIDH